MCGTGPRSAIFLSLWKKSPSRKYTINSGGTGTTCTGPTENKMDLERAEIYIRFPTNNAPAQTISVGKHSVASVCDRTKRGIDAVTMRCERKEAAEADRANALPRKSF